MEMRQYHARRAKRRLKKGALVLIAALLFIAVVVLLIIISVGGAEATGDGFKAVVPPCSVVKFLIERA